MRVEVQHWQLEDSTEDPGEVLLRLVTQSARRVAFYGELLSKAYADADRGVLGMHTTLPGGVSALIGHKYAMSQDGIYATSEAIRGLVMLETEERNLCANFATKAIAAGLAERQVRLAEYQGMMLASVIRDVLRDLDLSPEQTELAPAIVRKHLTSVDVAAS